MATGIDTLPEEVLAAIFQVASDEPTCASVYPTLPFAVAISRVSQRWRTIALGYPPLWTTIRISPRLRSWHWAALSVQRSGAHPLDISINLECYEPKSRSLERYPNPYDPDCPEPPHYLDADYRKPPRYLDVGKILAILEPHAARWRTIAIQGWYTQVLEILRSGHAAGARIESVHLAPLDGDYTLGDLRLQELTELVDTENLCALRISRKVFYGPLLSISLKSVSLTTLDVSSAQISESCTRQLTDSMSSLTTLVLRDVYSVYFKSKIKSSTIRFFAICFCDNPYIPQPPSLPLYKFLTETFLFPNLERLEIFRDVEGLANDHSQPHQDPPAEWETAAFPHLRALRLEDLELSPTILAHVQALSRGIIDLTLANVWCADCLLAPDVVGAWCDLKTLTIEWSDNSRTRQNPRSWSRLPQTDSAWLEAFVKVRAELGMPLTDVVLSQEVARSLRLAVQGPGWPPIRTLNTPSPALIDGGTQPGRRFYTNSVDQYDLDFEPVSPASEWWCVCGEYLGACGNVGDRIPCFNIWNMYNEELASSHWEDVVRQEDEIEVYGNMETEILRTMDVVQKARKEKRKRFKRVRS